MDFNKTSLEKFGCAMDINALVCWLLWCH